jgi:hypothetical protein
VTAKPLDDLKGYWRMRTQRMAFAGRESGRWFKSVRSMMAWTRTKSLPILGQAMSLAAAATPRLTPPEQPARHTDGLRPGTEYFSDILFAGEWAMEPQLLQG